MQQAIPYRSWQPLITHTSTTTTTHFTISPHTLTYSTVSPTGLSPKDNIGLEPNNNNNGNSHFFISSKMVPNMVLENAIIVFASRGCCMSHVVKRLLLGLGANPAVHEVEESDEVGVVRELEAIVGANNGGNKMQFPAVFIGGKLFGGLDKVMATHISGELVPILKEAGALWL